MADEFGATEVSHLVRLISNLGLAVLAWLRHEEPASLAREWRLKRTPLRPLVTQLPALLNLYALLGLVAATKGGSARLRQWSRPWRWRGDSDGVRATRSVTLPAYAALAWEAVSGECLTYEYDVVIDAGSIRKRKKKPSKPFRSAYGHTPLSAAEDIPWQCRRLVVGTGAHGAMPIMEEVEREAQARQVELLEVPTARAIEELAKGGKETNAILHVTC